MHSGDFLATNFGGKGFGGWCASHIGGWGSLPSLPSPLPALPDHHPASLPTPPHPPPLCTPRVPSWPNPQPHSARGPPGPPSRPSHAPKPSKPLGCPTPWRGRLQASGASPNGSCCAWSRSRQAMRTGRATLTGPRHPLPVKMTKGEMINFCDIFFNFSKLSLTVDFNFCAADRKIKY